jgi:hypothetical protein
MAPEVLDGTLQKDSFEAFLYADMYSFGLVLWELCRRTVTGDKNVSLFLIQMHGLSERMIQISNNT